MTPGGTLVWPLLPQFLRRCPQPLPTTIPPSMGCRTPAWAVLAQREADSGRCWSLASVAEGWWPPSPLAAVPGGGFLCLLAPCVHLPSAQCDGDSTRSMSRYLSPNSKTRRSPEQLPLAQTLVPGSLPSPPCHNPLGLSIKYMLGVTMRLGMLYGSNGGRRVCKCKVLPGQRCGRA